VPCPGAGGELTLRHPPQWHRSACGTGSNTVFAPWRRPLCCRRSGSDHSTSGWWLMNRVVSLTDMCGASSRKCWTWHEASWRLGRCTAMIAGPWQAARQRSTGIENEPPVGVSAAMFGAARVTLGSAGRGAWRTLESVRGRPRAVSLPRASVPVARLFYAGVTVQVLNGPSESAAVVTVVCHDAAGVPEGDSGSRVGEPRNPVPLCRTRAESRRTLTLRGHPRPFTSTNRNAPRRCASVFALDTAEQRHGPSRNHGQGGPHVLRPDKTRGSADERIA
jgi:hypothetical protein